MTAYTLIVSNPPHGAVDLDRAEACFGLSRAEAEMKIHYAVPEVWFAAEDPTAAAARLADLREAGLRVVGVTGEALRAVPPRALVPWVAFGRESLGLGDAGSGTDVPYQAPIVAVLCRPRRPEPAAGRTASTAMGRLSHAGLTPDSLVGRTEQRHRAPAVAGGHDEEHGAFLDLYVPVGDTVRRLAVFEGVTALADGGGVLRSDGVMGVGARCQERFPTGRFDRRLVNARVRTRILVGEYPADERRKGYSFATRALSQLLEAIDPGLKRLAQNDLSSRLAYLTIQADAQPSTR